MGRYFRKFANAFRKGDLVLLFMCLALNIFGILMIASTTNQMGPVRYLIIQSVAACLGIFMYVLVSSIDTEFMSEHRYWLVVFNCFLLAMLIPFGTDNGTGNKSWLDIPLMPVDIQPAEICKITYILIMASVMSSFQNRISSLRAVITIDILYTFVADAIFQTKDAVTQDPCFFVCLGSVTVLSVFYAHKNTPY